MRLLSGSSDILIALILLATVSCASTPPATSSGERFQLKGSIRVEGDHPFDRVIVLSDPQGVKWNLDPGGMEAELSLLDGYDVVLTCSGVPGRVGERDARVESYLLVPPEGMVVVMGRISISGETILLNSEDIGYMLTGPLTAALEAFGGHRAWIWGIMGDGDAVEVSGYEVLGP
jgi:hypothetical protein